MAPSGGLCCCCAAWGACAFFWLLTRMLHAAGAPKAPALLLQDQQACGRAPGGAPGAWDAGAPCCQLPLVLLGMDVPAALPALVCAPPCCCHVLVGPAVAAAWAAPVELHGSCWPGGAGGAECVACCCHLLPLPPVAGTGACMRAAPPPPPPPAPCTPPCGPPRPPPCTSPCTPLCFGCAPPLDDQGAPEE